jgi:ATP-dependent DNA helicase RecG
MVHPVVKVTEPDTPLPQTLTPVYSTVAGVSQTSIRRSIEKALASSEVAAQLKDFLPANLLTEFFQEGLPTLLAAVHQLHNPAKGDDLQSIRDRTHPAWRRIQVEELLAQQISLQQARAARLMRVAPRFDNKVKPSGILASFLDRLPFVLTNSQKKVWSEILNDLANGYPMNRLLQGDVGSGKTIIAALACAHAIDHGWQAAIMAPTEILAEQHYRKLQTWLAPLGVEPVWLTGSLKAKEKAAAQARIANGQGRLIVGTHALIADGVEFQQLGLVVVDEQHRFGVRQRLQLQKKIDDIDVECHQLMMSATPIPRTLAMSYYADLEISVIDELPPGRKPVTTKLVKSSRRQEILEGLKQELTKGTQVYWVCPLIEESEALQLQTAQATYEYLKNGLPGFQVGLIHGRLKTDEKNAVMTRFLANEIGVLVATTVIEVGVDVPNASLMVIEHAERFGYSQIHQLRGRVGRGSAESVCILLYEEPLSVAAKERLQTLKETQDGFVIAERDLQLRGPGELLGSKQSGDAMLRFVDLQRDHHLIAKTQMLASRLMKSHPDLVQQHLGRWLAKRADYLKA